MSVYRETPRKARRTRRVLLTRALISATLAFLAIYFVGCNNDVDVPELHMINIRIGEHTAVAEVAVTREQKQKGLMHRQGLLPNHGMLFVFEREEYLSFWMKDTYIPLSIAFIDARGRILQIEDMTPLSEEIHVSRAPALFALEMKQSWFSERDIRPGDRVEFPPELASVVRYYMGR